MKKQKVVVNTGALPIKLNAGEPKAGESLLPQLWRSSYHVPESFFDLQNVVANLRMSAKAKRLKIIGMTSALPSEGTSTVAVSIAMLLAGQSTRRKPGTLLVDAQLRHPSLHKIFGLANEIGLLELLQKGASSPALFKTAVKSLRSRAAQLPHGVSTPAALANAPAMALQVLTIGQGWQTPLAQINADKFRLFLRAAKPKFEFVLIDLPAVLSHADGVVLSKLCDGVVLVVQASQTRREAIAEAQRLLNNAKVNLLGAVLNRRKSFIPPWLYQTL
jgi:Mrp family chromosome partitioning ATPase